MTNIYTQQFYQTLVTHQNQINTLVYQQQQLEDIVETRRREIESLKFEIAQFRGNPLDHPQLEQTAFETPKIDAVSEPAAVAQMNDGIEIKYNNNRFDGVCRYLERKEGVTNLHDAGIVINTPSKPKGMDKVRKLTDVSHNGCWSGPNDLNSWVSFDFHQRRLALSGYSIKSGTGNHLQSWVIEGSNGGQEWHILDEICKCDELNRKKGEAYFQVKQQSVPFSTLRLRITGPNTKSKPTINFMNIEFFGTLYT